MITALILAAALAAPGETELKARLPDIFAKSAAHYKALDAAATPLRKGEMSNRKGRHNSDIYVPHGWNKWKTGRDELDMRPIYWWTAGHYPGSLWYLYEATGDGFFKDRATSWTELLAPNAEVTDNHDVGFIMYCSYGNARRILKTDKYDSLLAKTASSLSQRFNEGLGLLRSWGQVADTKDFLVIPDNMMNLELLEAVSKFTGDSRFDKIARSHATVTMKHHFRADGGTYHVLNYDQRPGFLGAVQEIRRGQGLGCETAWSRGQSWAIYGYTMMYRFTKDPAYLAFAQKVSDFAINHPNMPADGVPYWDYGAPGEERDSSAASIMASGLLELATFVGGEKGAVYRAFAVKQLLSLSSDEYFSKGKEIGHFLLKHGVGHKPGASEVDTPLDYGDYYFLEALLRYSAMKFPSADRMDGPNLVLDFPNSAWNQPQETIRKERNSRIKEKFSPVTEKTVLPPSGNKHDYMSIGLYWWPDPTKPDGKPYVRKDGEINPDCFKMDSSRLSRMIRTVRWLAAAAWRLADAEAGQEAARRVRAFFLDEKTMMNPNLNFGQGIPGRCDGRGTGIIDTYGLVEGGFLESLKILRWLGYLDDADYAGLQNWFSRYLAWLETSENGKDEAKAENNHGTAYDLQCVAFADFCGNADFVRKVLRDVAARRMDGKITSEGLQPLEAKRTKGINYSLYQLGMYCRLAYFGECYGIDIWNHVTPEGGSIRKAIEYILPYCRQAKPWPYRQIAPIEKESICFCEQALDHFIKKEDKQWCAK